MPKKTSRIMIFGRPGSGKSTFSLKLSKATGIPLYHLDKYFFEANWIERDYQEFLNIQQDMVDQDRWIIDGNSLKSLEMRFSRADMALYFNFPLGKCYFRVFKRLFDKDPEIDDRAEGCPERVNMSLVQFMWRSSKRVDFYLTFLRDTYPKVRFIEVKSDHDLKKLEQELLKYLIFL